ncbi:hypothetical protein [Psychrobacter sp.]|uniref:hypothetical protein n=1 Tax=Psychrobacter sp. TaxID=56811 RepID=UPI003C74943F
MVNTNLNRLSKPIYNSEFDACIEGDLNKVDIEFSRKRLIEEIADTVGEPFFPINAIKNSVKHDSSVFVLENESKTIAHIKSSLMITEHHNILEGQADGISFIICQYVSSCDFIYFPQYNFCSIKAHSDLKIASHNLKLYFKMLEKLKLQNSVSDYRSQLKGLIFSHHRPYHFFYDTAPIAEYLYTTDMLGKFPHYQVTSGSFLDIAALYQLSCKTIVTDFRTMNNPVDFGKNVLFKVGIVYAHFKEDYQNLFRDFDSRIVSNIYNVIDDYSIVNTIKELKNDDGFLLWFGISTDKRRLANQEELAVRLIKKLSKYYKVSVIVDGWTGITRQSFNNINKTDRDSLNLQADNEVFQRIKNSFSSVNFISLIGETSATKIAVSTLVDFHISSGATGSIWPARFGKKEGIFHNSQAFYKIQKNHIRDRGIDYPNSMVQDVVEKVKRVDYVSYNINENEFIEFIVNNYPNIFDNHFDYLRFNIERTRNLEVINLNKGEFSSLNNDPQFIIDIEKTETALNDSEYTLNLIGYLKLKDSGNHKCNIYLDYGEGFNAGQMVQAIMDSNSEFFEIDIKLEKPLKQLRFDPTSVKTNFVFKGLFYKIVNINNKD